MNGFSREAFRAWWLKEVNFVDPYSAAFQAWAAALEWHESQQHLLDELASSNAVDQPDIQELQLMKDISDLEYMINSLYKKWKYHVGHTYEWQEKNEANLRDITARLESLEKRTQES